jgi:glucose/arabinose dehydrogenase
MALSQPWVNARETPCLELVIEDVSGGELAFTALAFAPDGTLYAARPLAGEVWAIRDSDGDMLPDTPERAAAELTFPNGLAYHDGALYISGGAHLYRLDDGTLTTLIDSIPTGGGFWTGGVAVDAAGQLYVGVGAPCDACDFAGTGRGAIWRYNADGGNPLHIAAGVRFPADMTISDGILWVVDSGDGAADELNRVEIARLLVENSVHFGYPYCTGADNAPTLLGTETGFDCATAIHPALTFPANSQPLGIAPYISDAMPTLTGALLIALGGSYNQTELVGYRVVTIEPDANGSLTARPIIPVDPDPGNPISAFTLEQINYRNSGFWRHRPYDVAVSATGMIAISLGGGRILLLRQAASR